VLQQYPVDKALPPEVTTAASQLLQYLRYPVFSWSWWWRRAIFLLPIGVIIAAVNGNAHGVFAHDAAQAFAIAWRSAVIAMLLVGGGTLLAVAVRHAHLAKSFERVLLVLAIACGFFLTQYADQSESRYHTELMCELRGVKPLDCPDQPKAIDSSTLGAALQLFVPLGWYFIFGGGIALVGYFREQRSWTELQRQRERTQLELQVNEADARLAILQAQIEPHFLFNTLASLRSLTLTDPQRAVATVDALVSHLRATLPQMRDASAESRSTLGQQIDICRSYLEVMRVRMGTRLSYSVAAPESVFAMSFPPLMLLSLVENAIKHGVEPAPGPRTITIDACVRTSGTQAFLEVSVADDGTGLREGLTSGVGLANISSQLTFRYGKAASLTLSARIPAGTLAALRIPIDSRT
jgi:Histidine kinase